MLDMCVRKILRTSFFLAAIAVIAGCGAMDTILPSVGTYKVNVKINDNFLDDCSFAGSIDKIQPLFEESVSDDPDVSGLMIFLKDSKGEIAGWKVIYNLDDSVEPVQDSKTNNTKEDDSKENQDKTAKSGKSHKSQKSDKQDKDAEEILTENDNESENEDEIEEIQEIEEYVEEIDEYAQFEVKYKYGDEIIFPVGNLDDDLPFFPFPKKLPMGRYTLVFNVLSGDEILQKSEKNIFYLSDNEFLFESIQVHFPGIAESSQLVPKGTLIMLETDLNFDRTSVTGASLHGAIVPAASGASDTDRIDPYIIWYDGKKIISEGKFSDGAGNLLWKTPEQSGFFSLRAEVFPIANRQNLTGYQKEISLLVSSKPVDMHLIYEDNPELKQWYLFEGNLKDSKVKFPVESALIPAEENTDKDNSSEPIGHIWMPSDGTYGLAAGKNKAYTLPEISFLNHGIDNWQVLFRFKPLNDGLIFSTQFGASNAKIDVGKEENNLVLTLTSVSNSISEVYPLPENSEFVTVAMDFSIWPDRLTAKLNVRGNLSTMDEPVSEPVVIEAAAEGAFEIMLGQKQETVIYESDPEGKTNQPRLSAQTQLTAIWDELAVYYRQFTAIEIEENNPEDDQQSVPADSVNDDPEN